MPDNKVTVLVVDDEEVIRELLHFFLTKIGYSPLVAANGKDALIFAREKKPDIVLLDIKMPDMDGHQTCQELRSISNFSVPMGIIMITGFASLNNKEKAIGLGADDLLEKHN